jgi:L-glyceraldehyde reductase
MADVRVSFRFPVAELPASAMEKISKLERNNRYNFPARYGVDIFGDADPDFMEKAVDEFRAKQKELRGVA